MTRVPKRARLSRMAMPWKPVVSEPHRRMVAMSAMTTPPSPTKARCSRRPRGGRRSKSMRRKPVTASTAAGPMMRRLMTGTGIISVMARGSPSWRGQGHRGRRLRLHLGDEGAHARLRLPRERHGIDADPEDEGEHGDEDDPLARREIAEAAVLLPRHLAEDHPLVHPQHVHGGEDDAGGGDDGERAAHLEGADEDAELAHEAVEPGQPDRREGHHEEESERARGEAVVDHLDVAALHPLLVQGKEAEDDEAEVTHARMGHELLDI